MFKKKFRGWSTEGGKSWENEADKAAPWKRSLSSLLGGLPCLLAYIAGWPSNLSCLSPLPGVNRPLFPLGSHPPPALCLRREAREGKRGVEGCPFTPSLPSWACLPQNNLPPSMMTRRNTYVCTERPGAERPSLLPNGKENRYGGESTLGRRV